MRAGVRSIEHGTYLDQESAELMVERGTWLVPTLTAGDTTEELANDEKLAAGDPREVPRRSAGRSSTRCDWPPRPGVKVAMGTDAAVMPHGWNLNELDHMANNGFTPEQALHAATLSAPPS